MCHRAKTITDTVDIEKFSSLKPDDRRMVEDLIRASPQSRLPVQWRSESEFSRYSPLAAAAASGGSGAAMAAAVAAPVALSEVKTRPGLGGGGGFNEVAALLHQRDPTLKLTVPQGVDVARQSGQIIEKTSQPISELVQSCRMVIWDGFVPSDASSESDSASSSGASPPSDGNSQQSSCTAESPMLIKQVDTLSKEMFGFSDEQMLGRNFYSLFRRGDTPASSSVLSKLCDVTKAIRKREKISHFMNVYCQNGEALQVQLQLQPLNGMAEANPPDVAGSSTAPAAPPPQHCLVLLQIVTHRASHAAQHHMFLRECRMQEMASVKRDVSETADSKAPDDEPQLKKAKPQVDDSCIEALLSLRSAPGQDDSEEVKP